MRFLDLRLENVTITEDSVRRVVSGGDCVGVVILGALVEAHDPFTGTLARLAVAEVETGVHAEVIGLSARFQFAARSAVFQTRVSDLTRHVVLCPRVQYLLGRKFSCPTGVQYFWVNASDANGVVSNRCPIYVGRRV